MSMKNPFTIGIIGGGQLGKMICLEAKRLSLNVVILDPDPICPASSIANEQIIADFKDENAIFKLSDKCDLITYEIELANSMALGVLSEQNYAVHPSPATLSVIQDKYKQKVFLKENNISVPNFNYISSLMELKSLCKDYGYPSILKSCTDSYDGRGNYLIRNESDIEDAYNFFKGKKCMVEQFIDFEMEVSIMVSRNLSGAIASFPVVQNIHINNILDTTIAPASIPDDIAKSAIDVAKKTLDSLRGSGIFGIEMFVSKDGKVLINEIAPRPHNSGHYSIEVCAVSQFEQHLRAILDLPIIDQNLICPAVMVNILGPGDFSGYYKINGLKKLMSIPGANLHLYGKQISKPNRKLGHITLIGNDLEKLRHNAKIAKSLISITPEDN